MTYIILDKATRLYKIGKTQNIKKRLATLGTSNINLSLVLITELDERFLHKLFKDKRIVKEWFGLTKEDILSIIELEREK